MLLRRVAAFLTAGRRYFSTEAAATSSTTGGSITATGTSSGGRDTLGRRLLKLIYPKRSAVITIQKWKEEGHSVRKYELNRIVRELRKVKRYKHALEICEWMTIQQDIKLLPGDYAVHLDLIAKIRGLKSAEKFFEDLPSKLISQPTCTALLHTYVQHKESSKAEALMEKMSECGFLKYPLPYNHMITLYISKGQLDKIPKVIQDLKNNTKPDVVTYNLWLTLCASKNDVKDAEEVFLDLKKERVVPDWVTYSILTSLYIKNKLKEKAVYSVKEMEKRVSRKERVAYSSLISLHTNMGDKDGVNGLWRKMKLLFRKLNDSEYTCMMSSLVKLAELKKAEKLYAEWESVSSTGDSRVSNILLAAYINTSQIGKAENFYNKMVEKGIKPSYTTWELLTWGYLKLKDNEKVMDYFKKAIGSVKKWDPDEKLIRAVYKSFEEEGDVNRADHLLVILRKAGHVSTEIYKLLLRTYAKAGKMPLIVAERMKKDKVELDEETRELIKLTSQMCVAEVSSNFS